MNLSVNNEIKLLTIGADPEVFLRDKVTHKVVPAIGLIPGDKYNPHMVSEEGHAIQVDNVTAEICIPPENNPVKTAAHIKFALKKVEEFLPDNLEIFIKASAIFTDEDLADPIAQMFGCDPDFSAWTCTENPKPNSNTNLRSAGGHVHIGFTDPTEEKCILMVKTMDLFLGVPSIILDTDNERRKLYGKAGAFRFKEFGIEYRTLSNFWIENETLVTWVYNNIVAAIKFINENKDITEDDMKNIVNCINTGDQELAKTLCDKYNVNYKP